MAPCETTHSRPATPACSTVCHSVRRHGGAWARRASVHAVWAIADAGSRVAASPAPPAHRRLTHTRCSRGGSNTCACGTAGSVQRVPLLACTPRPAPGRCRQTVPVQHLHASSACMQLSAQGTGVPLAAEVCG